jgi:predicted nucleic acid-binding protein
MVTMGLLDTSVFIAAESGRALDGARMPDEIRVSVISVGELRRGVLVAANAMTRAMRLASLTRALSLEPVPIDEGVAECWAELRATLRDLGRRMPVNDSWIAATAMSLGVPVVTQDDDFVDGIGVEVLRV